MSIDDDLETIEDAVGWACERAKIAETIKQIQEAWRRIERYAKIGAWLEQLPHLLTVPDSDGYNIYPDYVQVGVDNQGCWSVQRWKETDPFDEDGPIGECKSAFGALETALKFEIALRR